MNPKDNFRIKRIINVSNFFHKHLRKEKITIMLSCSVSTLKVVANYLKLAIHSNCGHRKETIMSRY